MLHIKGDSYAGRFSRRRGIESRKVGGVKCKNLFKKTFLKNEGTSVSAVGVAIPANCIIEVKSEGKEEKMQQFMREGRKLWYLPFIVRLYFCMLGPEVCKFSHLLILIFYARWPVLTLF